MKNKWLGHITPVKSVWGKPVSGQMIPNSATYATTCKDSGIYWHYGFTSGGTWYNQCKASLGSILSPIGKATPEEFRGNLDYLGKEAKADTKGLPQSANQVVKSAKGTTKQEGHLQQVTILLQCDPGSSDIEFREIVLQQQNRLVDHKTQYLPVKATVTSC